MSEILSVIRSDGEYKKFKRIFTTIQERLKLDTDRAEINQMHATRELHGLIGKAQYNPEKLYSSMMHDARSRARMTKIRQAVQEQHDLLKRAIKAFRTYAILEFKEELRSYTTQIQRMAIIDRVLTKALDLEADCETFVTHVDKFIQDIDQIGYTYTNSTKLIEIILGAKAKKV